MFQDLEFRKGFSEKLALDFAGLWSSLDQIHLVGFKLSVNKLADDTPLSENIASTLVAKSLKLDAS